MKKRLSGQALRSGLLAALMTVTLSFVGTAAESDQDQALATGAKPLSAEEIEALIVGNTVTAKAGGKVFVFHYSADNVLRGELLGGGWSDRGYYGVTDGNQACVSMTKDRGRLRCLTLLKTDGMIRKYNARGEASFAFVKVEEGDRL